MTKRHADCKSYKLPIFLQMSVLADWRGPEFPLSVWFSLERQRKWNILLSCTVQSWKHEGNSFSMSNTFVFWILSYISKFKNMHWVSFLQCKSDFLSSSLVQFLSCTCCFLGCSTENNLTILISESSMIGKLLTLIFSQRKDVWYLYIKTFLTSLYWIIF